MGMVKYSVLALLIMFPFFIQSSIQNIQFKYKERQRVWIESAVDEASYDAGFAMKTYSIYEYDSDTAYRIQIAYDEVIRHFFDSLAFRGFKYRFQDFPMIAFIEYDGVVLYYPEEQRFGDKKFYAEPEAEQCTYYTLSEKAWKLDYETGEIVTLTSDLMYRNKVIIQTIETELNKGHGQNTQRHRIGFSLPEFEGTTSTYIFDDVGIIVFYDPESYAYIDGLASYKIVPSGLMKMDVVVDEDDGAFR